MHFTRAIAVGLVGAAALAVVSPAAAGSRTYGNTVTMLFRSGPAGDHFQGRVHSKKPACRAGRKIVIFRKRAGADQRVRAARSRHGGRWEAVPAGGRAGAGRYYAVMRQKVLRGGADFRRCAPVTTGVLRVPRR